MSLFSFMHHDDEIPKNKQVQDLELSKIVPNRYQPRREFSDDSIKELAETLDKDQTILVNLSGRGDKDIDFVMQNYPLVEYEPDENAENESKYKEFLSHIQHVKK